MINMKIKASVKASRVAVFFVFLALTPAVGATSSNDGLAPLSVGSEAVKSESLEPGNTDKELALTSAKEDKVALDFIELISEVDTLMGRFEQTIFDQEGAEIQRTSGSYKIKRPGYFLWSIAPPYEQIVVGTPEHLKVYDPDLEQLTVHSKDSLSGSPAMILSGDLSRLTDKYHVSLAQDKGEQAYVLSHKNDEEGAFERLLFSLEKDGQDQVSVKSLSLWDKLGQNTLVVFDQVQRNQSIESSVFELDVPPGTDIIVND